MEAVLGHYQLWLGKQGVLSAMGGGAAGGSRPLARPFSGSVGYPNPLCPGALGALPGSPAIAGLRRASEKPLPVVSGRSGEGPGPQRPPPATSEGEQNIASA